MVDLHQHSNFSDGTDSVEELILKNKTCGIEVMSISDHDNIGSTKSAGEIAEKVGVKYITGVEFSTQFNGQSIHILAYNFDKNDQIVDHLIKEGKDFRHKRIEKRLELLENQFGINIGEEAKLKLKQKETPGRPMVANFLIEQGYGSNISEVIQKYMYHRLPEYELETVYTIKSLSESSGFSVYAHPLGGVGEKNVDKTVFEARLKLFVAAGLKGMECYYSMYSKEEQDYLVSMANKYNLFITAGSDYHGKNKDVKIGELSSCGFVPDKSQITILNHI